MAKGLPLQGIRVVDVTVVWAGPHCTQLLAEWGAEVIRVEPLQHVQPSTRGGEQRVTKAQVDAMRAAGQTGLGFPDWDPGERPWNRSPSFNSHARNKLSMTCDIMTPEGLDIFKRLVAVSDVVVENNVPETIEKAGITYEDLAKVNPRIIMLRMPAFGLSGPYKNYRAFGTHMEGMVGHHWLRGYPGMEPSYTGEAFTADAASGVLGAFAVTMALRHRRRTGRGQQIEMAQSENFVNYLGEYILDYTFNGRVAEPQGNLHRTHAPHGVFPCLGPDRWLALDVTSEGEWRALCRVMGDPEWTRGPQFADMRSRKANEVELNQRIAAWTKRRDRYALFRELQAAGVRAGPTQDEADLFACPQLQSRGFFEAINMPEVGEFQYPGLIFKMSKTPNHLRTPPCRLGEHNDYVYRDILKVSETEYDELKAKGHIGMDYPHLAPTAPD